MRWIVLALSLFVAGCCRTEYSGVLEEAASVDQVIYVPATHGTGMGPTMGENVGMAVVFVDTQPDWCVVFKCQHGKFVVHDKAVWRDLRQGDRVTVRYREKYCIRKDGKHLTGYDFLSAVTTNE